jgi:hypothetical protein
LSRATASLGWARADGPGWQIFTGGVANRRDMILVLVGLAERELRRDGGIGLRIGLFNRIEPVIDAADAVSSTISTGSPLMSGCCSLTISLPYLIAAHSDSLSSTSDAGEEMESASEGAVVAAHALVLRIQSLKAASWSLMVVEGAGNILKDQSSPSCRFVVTVLR